MPDTKTKHRTVGEVMTRDPVCIDRSDTLREIARVFDDNDISIDGSTDITFTEDVAARFESYNWHVVHVEDGRREPQPVYMAVDRSVVLDSDRTYVCPWKGVALYYDLEVGGRRLSNAAWYYPDPKDAAAEIRDHVAFERVVKVRELAPAASSSN